MRRIPAVRRARTTMVGALVGALAAGLGACAGESPVRPVAEPEPAVAADPVEELDPNDVPPPDLPDLGDFATLFDPSKLQEIHLTLAPDAITALDEDGTRYVEGTFEHDGAVLTVGVHLKGSSTYQDFTGKPAFRVKFDAFVHRQRYATLKHLSLNNLTGDPAQGREVVAYMAFSAGGVPAPAASLARVYVNDEYYGLYACLEPVDEEFLARRFADPTGDLWEANDHAELTADGIANFELGAGGGDGPVTLDDAAAAFSAWTPDFYTQASTVVDMEEFLDFWAWTIATGGLDGYPYHYNDYFLYGDPSRGGRFVFMPWGQDETWNELWMFDYGAGVMGWGCGGDAACAAKLDAHVDDALSTYESIDVPSIAQTLFSLSRTAVEDDPRSPYLPADVEVARAALVDRMRSFPSTVRLAMGL